MMENSGQLKTKSWGGYPKFTAVREAAAEANTRTSAETKRSLPRRPMRLFAQRALSLSSSRISHVDRGLVPYFCVQ
ncbi:Uncharacterized protein DBV15_09137 [Temnothorax longispinosus]|uniref:Uncharacterized protein n=1 Tax=Temnothorax longispinosus TaxID=300112 RepID=A0A4S2KGD9_9HYME|nr:Uncharacterized protein DBV15_09137 [Temnothorax longispinosus]